MITYYDFDLILENNAEYFKQPNSYYDLNIDLSDYLEPAKARGYIFEHICLNYLNHLNGQYKFYLWADKPLWLNFPKQDIGIDIIGISSCPNLISEKTEKESIIGIQCKWRANKRYKTADIDHFYMALMRLGISRGIFMSNSTRDFKDSIINNILIWGPHNTPINNIYKRENFMMLGIRRFNELYWKGINIGKYNLYEPRIYQWEAYQAMLDAYENRQYISKYIIACGAGKTYIYWLFARYLTARGKKLLIIVPTLILKEQIQQNFTNLNIEILTYQYFCKGLSETCFGKGEYKFIIYDEAHHTTAPEYNKILNIGKYNFLFTGTDKKKLGVSFSKEFEKEEEDEEEILEPSYKYSFEQALEEKIICDFKICLYILNGEIEKDKNLIPNERYAILANQLKLLGNEHTLAYTNSINNILEFKKYMNYIAPNIKVYALYSENSCDRDKILKEFELYGGVLISCKLISEGLNIPKVENICYADEKNSEIDIIQTLSRALRVFEGKEYAKLIIPQNYYNGTIDLDNICNIVKTCRKINKNAKIEISSDIELNFDNIYKDIELRLLENKEFRFDYMCKLLEEFAELNGRIIKSREIFKEKKIGKWYYFNKFKKKEILKEIFKNNKIIYEDLCKEKKIKITNEKKKELLISYINKFNKLPKWSEKYNGYNIGYIVQNLNRNKEQNLKLYKDIPLIYKYLNREIIEIKKTTNEKKKELLISYINEFNKLPKFEEKYKGYNIGHILNTLNKDKEKNLELYKDIPFIYEYLNKEKKTIVKTTNEEKKELLISYINEFNKLPKFEEKYKGYNIGYILQVLNRNRENNLKLYKNISIIGEYLNKEKETVIKTTNKEKKELLISYINEFNKLPKQTEKYKGYNIGYILNKLNKNKEQNSELYKDIPLIYEYLNREIIEIKKTTDEEKKELLISYINEFNILPKQKEKYKGYNIGSILNKLNKNKEKNLELYNDIPLICEYLNREKKTTIKITDGEKKELIISYINEFNILPKIKEKYKGYNIGHILNTLNKDKEKNLELYNNIPLICEYLNREKKRKISNEEKKIIIQEFINIYNRLPKKNEIYKSYNLKRYLYEMRKSKNKQKYLDLFADVPLALDYLNS